MLSIGEKKRPEKDHRTYSNSAGCFFRRPLLSSGVSNDEFKVSLLNRKFVLCGGIEDEIWYISGSRRKSCLNGGSDGGGGPAVQKEDFKIVSPHFKHTLYVHNFKRRFAAEGALICDIGAK